MAPKVSIIIPTYNRAKLILETLDSIESQTHTNWECIVVDDGSTDETEMLLTAYIRKDARFQYHKRPQSMPKGANSCRNYGFGLSNGEFINWFDSDDVMLPQKLELQLQELSERIDCYMCVCQTLVFEDTVKNILPLPENKIFSEDPLNDYITHDVKLLTPTPLFRRDFLETNQLQFDENLQQSQEWDFFIKVFRIATHYTAISEPLVLLRKHGSSITYGKKTPERLMSSYNARKKLFQGNSAFSEKTLAVLRKSVVVFYGDFLSHGFFPEANIVRRDINSNLFNFTFVPKLKMNLAYLSYRLTGKGHYFTKGSRW